MNSKTICNARILTMNDGMEVIKNGFIRIKNGKIEAIGEMNTFQIQDTSECVEDMSGMLIMPGFVNTHTHVPMTLLRGYADDLPLHQWLTEYIFPAEARLITREHVRIATRLALVEMIKSGTTCFNDMYFFEDVIAEEAKHAGIRGVMNESLIDFPTASFKSVDEGLALSEELIRTWRGDHYPSFRNGPCPLHLLKRNPAKSKASGRQRIRLVTNTRGRNPQRSRRHKSTNGYASCGIPSFHRNPGPECHCSPLRLAKRKRSAADG